MKSFEDSLEDTIETLHQLTTLRTEVEGAGDLILNVLAADNKLLICGNGGSAAEAAHFATELVGRYRQTRRPLPAIALTEGGALSCIANDFDFHEVFSRQVKALGQPGDLLVALSSSGNSENIRLALRTAHLGGLHTLALLGRGGGRSKGIAEREIIVPGHSGAAAQEAHLFLIHHFCERIDEAFAK